MWPQVRPSSPRARSTSSRIVLDQALDRLELDHPAEAFDERHLDLHAVQLEVGAVEDVALDAAFALAVEGRVRADADRRRVGLTGVAATQPAGVHTVGGARRACRWSARSRSGSRARGRAGRPRTTTPRTVNARPSASAAPATSPVARQVRTYVDDQTCGPPSSAMPSTTKSRVSPPRAACATSPAARLPKRKLAPTTTAAACSASTRIRSMNSSGVQPAISRSNGSTRTASAPSPADSAARVSIEVRVEGACSGRSTAIGCGSKVTATTVGPERPRPRGRDRSRLVPEVHAVEVADGRRPSAEVGRNLVEGSPYLHGR